MRQIITLSQGRLGVDSRPGQGSVFWFELSYEISSVDVVEGKEGEESEASAEELSTTASCQSVTALSSAPAEKVPGEEQIPLPENAQPPTTGTKDISGGSATEKSAQAVG